MDAIKNLEKVLESDTMDVENIRQIIKQLPENTEEMDADRMVTLLIDKMQDRIIYLIDELYDLSLLMRDPRNIHTKITEISIKYTQHSLKLCLFQHWLMTNCCYLDESFLSRFIDSISKKTLENEESEILMHRIVVYFEEQKALCYSNMCTIIKKLVNVALEVDTQTSAIILYGIMLICRLKPALYKFVPSIVEFNIFLCGIDSIKKIVKKILDESRNISSRIKVQNLGNVRFPKI